MADVDRSKILEVVGVLLAELASEEVEAQCALDLLQALGIIPEVF